ncbi:SPP1 gp7 family putative phage head morphogenesis protein [Desulfitispora alkaliphila]|uniref:minor capsid protein n=1 Tax=Desulfitispora alkaliphila TaxID=622674 RepID=UPI003D1E6DD3
MTTRQQKQLQKEIEQLQLEMEDMTAEEARELLHQYQKSSRKITALASGIIAGYMVDGQLDISPAQMAVEMRDFEREIEEEANKIGALEVGVVGGILAKVYKDSYYKTAFTLDRGLIDSSGIAINVSFDILRDEFVQRAINIPIEGQMFSDRIWTNKEKLVTRLRNDLLLSMRKGSDTKVLARRIQRDFDVGWNEAFRLIRNETARCRSQAQEQIYQENDVVKQLLFDATLDDRTTEICQELHGNIYDKNEPHPAIPDETHIQCRSCYVPVVEGWNPTTKRDNLSKEVIDYPKNFEDWKRQKGIGDD